MSGPGVTRPGAARPGEHLQLLRISCSELQRAMQAISSNDLAGTEESIANQQDLERPTELAWQAI